MDDGFLVRARVGERGTVRAEPYALDGVVLWRIGRERDQGDGVRSGQGGAGLPPGAIENHDYMVVGDEGFGGLGQEQIHGDG